MLNFSERGGSFAPFGSWSSHGMRRGRCPAWHSLRRVMWAVHVTWMSCGCRQASSFAMRLSQRCQELLAKCQDVQELLACWSFLKLVAVAVETCWNVLKQLSSVGIDVQAQLETAQAQIDVLSNLARWMVNWEESSIRASLVCFHVFCCFVNGCLVHQSSEEFIASKKKLPCWWC